MFESLFILPTMNTQEKEHINWNKRIDPRLSKKFNLGLSNCCSVMFNLGLYF